MKYFRYIGIISIVLFSFYYTEKVSNYVLEKNSLYQEIDDLKSNYNIKSVSAVIEDDYIIPGYNGKEVNVKSSYYNMKDIEVFNEYYLVYDETKPEVSLDENKDKIIIKGNKNKKSVAIVIENDNNIMNYFQNSGLKANVMINYEEYDNNCYFEQINNDVNKYDKLDTLLKNNEQNKDICIINENIESICRDNDKYLIKPIEVSNNNYIEIKNNIESGNIYLIKKNTKVENISLLIKDIKYKDLDIVYVSELIKEER